MRGGANDDGRLRVGTKKSNRRLYSIGMWLCRITVSGLLIRKRGTARDQFDASVYRPLSFTLG
jgi:hypothetical protein